MGGREKDRLHESKWAGSSRDIRLHDDWHLTTTTVEK